MPRIAFAALAVVFTFAAVPVHAQGVPGADRNRCLAGKNKCVSKKIKGLMKCSEKCQKKPAKCGQALTDCEQKVMGKFDGGLNPAKGCFAKLEGKADPLKPESVCTTTGDTASMEILVDTAVGDLLATLEGMPPTVCGDGVVEGSEECDFGDLDGETCDSLTASAEPFGTLACTQGTCAFDTSGCAPRFEDTGLTVIDHETGLEWEKKTGTLGAPSDCPGGANCGDLNDVNNRYSWSDTGQLYDGDAELLFVNGLNDTAGGGASCFAGRCDWRLPSLAMPGEYGVIDQGEWDSIVDCSGGAPCLDSNFGPTASADYWTSTPNGSGPWATWIIDFLDGSVGVIAKSDVTYVRAVRGGS